MSESRERVWQSMRVELRRRRRARRAVLQAALLVPLAAAVAWLAVAPRPVEPGVAAVAIPPTAEPPVDEPLRMAVLVYRGDALRLEMVGAGDLSATDLSLDLEPVVWSQASW